MGDVNEELVRRYFERQDYFVRTNISYQAEGGQWSDLDLCILCPRTLAAAVDEVKGWGQNMVTAADINGWNVFSFVNGAALQKAAAVLGRDFRRILILPRVAEGHREYVMGLAQEKQVEILAWPDVLQFLITRTPINP